MLHVVARWVRAAVAGRPLQSALVVLLIASAAGTATLALNIRRSADEPFDRAFAAAHGAQVHVFGRQPGADVRRAARVPGVEAVSGPHPYAAVRVDATGHRPRVDLIGLDDPRTPAERPLLREGRWVRSGAAEVVLDRGLGRALGLRPGDAVSVVAGERTARLTVTGLATTTATGPYASFSPVRSWTGERTLRGLAGGRLLQLADLRLADPGATGPVARATVAGRPGVGVYTEAVARDAATERARADLLVLGSSTVFVLIAVALIVANLVAARVLALRRDTGVLKAVGLTPAQVTGVLLAEQLALALLAALAGVAAGVAASPPLLERSSSLLGAPAPGAFDLGTALIVVAGICLVVAAFTALPAWRAGRTPAAVTLREQRSGQAGRPSRLAGLASTLRLPAPVVLGVKDAFTARSRAALTIGSLAITVAVAVVALSAEATFSRVIDDPALRAKPWDVLLRTAPATARDRLPAVLDRHRDEIAARFSVDAVEGRVPGAGRVEVRGLAGDYRRSPYAVPDGRTLTGPGEVTVGRGLLDAAGLRVGDRLAVDIAGRRVALRIVGRHVEPDNDGMVAIADARSLPQAALRGSELSDVALKVAPGADPAGLRAALVREAGPDVEVLLTRDEVEAERADLRPIVLAMDGVLLLIGLVNLLTTLLLGVRERARDFGLFKVLGLTPRQLLVTVSATGSMLALAATAVGLPVGVAVFRVILRLDSPSDGPDVATIPTWWWLALVPPAAVLLTVLAGALPARVAGRIDAASALRAE